MAGGLVLGTLTWPGRPIGQGSPCTDKEAEISTRGGCGLDMKRKEGSGKEGGCIGRTQRVPGAVELV